MMGIFRLRPIIHSSSTYGKMRYLCMEYDFGIEPHLDVIEIFSKHNAASSRDWLHSTTKAGILYFNFAMIFECCTFTTRLKELS